MTKKIILLLLSFTLMVSSLCGCGSSNNEEIDMNQKKVEKMPKENFSEVENSDDSFIPVIRFAVCSDVHISNTDQVEAERFAKLFESAYRFSEENKYYKNLDAVIVVGDMTNSGYEAEYDAFKSIINEPIIWKV